MSVARFNNRFLATAQSGGGTPSDPVNSVQYNDAGALGGDASFTFDGTNVTTTNAYFADGGIDTSVAGSLDLAQDNATSVTIGRAPHPITAAITIPDGEVTPWTIVDENGNNYMEIRTAASRYVAFGDNNVPPNYFFQGTAITMVVGADAGGEVEAASFGPGGLTFFDRDMFVGTNAQALSVTVGHDAADLNIDSQDVIVTGAPLTLGALAGDPGAVAGAGRLYTKTDTVTELFYQDDAGNVSQLTPLWQTVGVTDDVELVTPGNVYLGHQQFLFGRLSGGSATSLVGVDSSDRIIIGDDNAIAMMIDVPDNRGGVSGGFQVRNAVGSGRFIHVETGNNNEKMTLGEAGGLTGGMKSLAVYVANISGAVTYFNGNGRTFYFATPGGASPAVFYGNTVDPFVHDFRGARLDVTLPLVRFPRTIVSPVITQEDELVNDTVGDALTIQAQPHVGTGGANVGGEAVVSGGPATGVGATSNTGGAARLQGGTGSGAIASTGGNAIVRPGPGGAEGSHGRSVIQDSAGNVLFQAGPQANRLAFFGGAAAVQPPAYSVTNVVTDRDFDADATTLEELADVVGTLIADLQSLTLLAT